jgi:alpha-mannosidase
MGKRKKKRAHLIANAHLDPVWLWPWEEGAAEAIATFRSAADLCEAFDGFVFNHNEAILYEWIEEYEPALFKRIQRLVQRRQWHIMGGWYLQPDCNMPSGESFVRQILLGKMYFRAKFGVEPSTAINFDPFGHTRGLVQILTKSGYDAYLFGRPLAEDLELPNHDFTWVGYDGSSVTASRFIGWYNSHLGKIDEKIEQWRAEHPDPRLGVLLWGVGNHGGGPSRIDVRKITDVMKRRGDDHEFVHSTPEAYFAELRRSGKTLTAYKADLNPWGVGCYTSQVRVKQKHRQLENELYATEKMAVAASCAGLEPYPGEALATATRDLMFAEFHDILPGSSVQPVEEASLRLMDHALEELSRVKARLFFALAQGEPRAKPGRIPILVYNPHPYTVRTIVECEFVLPDANLEDRFTNPIVFAGSRRLACQTEQELSNVPVDWRKRVVYVAELKPSQMNRFDCELAVLRARPKPQIRARGGQIRVATRDLDVVVNTRTGLIDRYRVRGRDAVGPGACRPVVLADTPDPWGMTTHRFDKILGAFKLMSRGRAARFAAVRRKSLDAVRVIEDGDVRTVIEALFAYGASCICQRYKIPKVGTEIEVEVHVHWNEKDRMLKLAVPVRGRRNRYVGQVAYGVGDLPCNGDEAVAHKWVAVVSDESRRALTCINDGVYGSDFDGKLLRMTLLRSPAYSAHPFPGRTLMPQDRYSPRIDQGERVLRFWLNAGPSRARLDAIDREALVHNEVPMALSFNPPGAGRKPPQGISLGDGVVQVAAVKQTEKGRGTIVRLFEPTGRKRTTTLRLPCVGLRRKVALSPFEIKSLKIDPQTRKVVEVDLLERPIRAR